MANMVASPLLRLLSHRLCSLTDHSLDMKDLQLTLAELQTMVLEAENKSEEEDAFRRWLTEVKDAAYEADDVVDEFSGLSTFKFSSYLLPSQWLLRFNLQRKMKYIEERFDALLARRMKFQKATPSLTTPEASASFDGIINIKVPYRETRSFVSESDIVGREEDKISLMGRLLYDSGSKFKVLPIVGMGGLGKTTLAQSIYNDEAVVRHFDRRYWVSVNQVFDVRMIGKAIMENHGSEKFRMKASRFLLHTEETVDAIVRGELRGRRFLIVLDDVWNENQEKWDVLQRWFAVGARGSTVLMTTRSSSVADLVRTVKPYNLKPLSVDDAWLLFRHVAFGFNDEENVGYVEIGKRLVDRCKGLPLAIKTLAGLMRFKREESEWLQIKDDNLWEFPEFGSSVLPALRLSYNHLPSHLKQCFAYCSLFPQGVTISKETLIQLWIAEGFVQSNEGSRSLEDIGNEYFMELWRRSFFVEIWRDDSGEIVECQMHNLIHDLARSVASVGCTILESSTLQNAPEEVRHSSVVFDSEDQLSAALEVLQKSKRLRTLLLFCGSGNLEKIPQLLLKLRSLRALYLNGSGIQKLSKLVARLKHLRYLNLSRTPIERLPDSLGKLLNLNTLELIECYNLQVLPVSICELTNLRHLDIQSCCSLSHMPYGIGKLRLLQKLPLFVLSNVDGSAHIGELRELDIRGRLEIKNLELGGKAENAKLHKKHKLRSLKLSWSHDAETSANYSPDEVLEKLMPPEELKVLHIIGYNGKSYPSWIMNSVLINLAKVSLVNCSCERLPPLGHLPNLSYLYIKQMLAVEVIDYEFYGDDAISAKGFPSLQQLELYDLPNLKLWWSFRFEQFGSSDPIEELSSSVRLTEAFPCLEFLTIKGCRKLTILPELPNLKNLALWDCSEELLLSLDRLTTLATLVINEFHMPLALPLPNLNSIKNVTLYNCDNLLAGFDYGMKSFSSVEHLRILYCDTLKVLPLDLGYLTFLKKLEIAECRELVELPDVMQNFQSLEEFIIDGCPKLKSLPNSISQIKLGKLVIRRCPELCKKLLTENSREWSKTAHIPVIEKDCEEHATEEEDPY